MALHAARRLAASHRVLCFNGGLEMRHGRGNTATRAQGDGIGPEIVSAAKTCIAATGVDIDWLHMDMGFEAKQRTGDTVTEEHVKAFEDIGVLFKGPLTIPPGDSGSYIELRGRRFTSGNQVFRKLFQLYANVRPAKNMPGIQAPCQGVNMVIVRENTEDVYTGEETWVDEDTVECIKRITRGASQRVARYAIEYALANGRRRVTALHKVAEELNARDRGLIIDDQLADSCLTKMVQVPSDFDVLCCPNLYGDLVSDLAGGMIGSLGLCPSSNIGEKQALFEPAHGSAPDIAGQGIANPASQILSGVQMLFHLGEQDAGKRLEGALADAFASGTVPMDLGGKATTAQMTEAVVSRLQ